MECSRFSMDVYAAIIEARRLSVLRKSATVVVNCQVVETAQCILKLQQPHFVHLAEALGEQQREHLQLEEARVETERGENRAPHATFANRPRRTAGRAPPEETPLRRSYCPVELPDNRVQGGNEVPVSPQRR